MSTPIVKVSYGMENLVLSYDNYKLNLVKTALDQGL